MTLRLLREVRAKQDDHDRKLDVLSQRFDEMRGYVVHALGLGSMNDMEAQELAARMEAGEVYRRRIDEKFIDRERRLTRVEEKID